MTLVAFPLRHLLSLHRQVAARAHQMLLDLIFPDPGMPRGQALAGIGEALQRSAERLRARGFQTRMQPAAGASVRTIGMPAA